MKMSDFVNKNIDIVAREIGRLDLGSRVPTTLYQPMQYIMEQGGKRLRPLVALLAYRAYAPEIDLERVFPALRAIELFHNFSLLHDDVMDDAPLRRGEPTVYKKWGSNTAILSGDGMLVEAYKQLEDLPSEYLAESLRLFNDMAISVCKGQQYDGDYEDRDLDDISLAEYVGMIRLKTSYLFCGSVSLGAYLANAPQSDREILWKAVEMMGLAFQIMDDYLDVFADSEFGKQLGGDILVGKRTWLLISAYQKDPVAIKQAMSISDDNEKVTAVIKLYEQLGVAQDALDEIDHLTSLANDELSRLSLPSERIEPLRQLFLSLVRRSI